MPIYLSDLVFDDDDDDAEMLFSCSAAAIVVNKLNLAKI